MLAFGGRKVLQRNRIKELNSGLPEHNAKSAHVASSRQAVRDATLDTTAALVAKHGLRAVTMSEIADKTGIGRATLYKYYPDVESILRAWHERHISGHLEPLAALSHKPGPAIERFEAVLDTFELASYCLVATILSGLRPAGGSSRDGAR